jgi:hypothetical protein
MAEAEEYTSPVPRLRRRRHAGRLIRDALTADVEALAKRWTRKAAGRKA